MNIPFVKYHGTGNDFVMIDQRKQPFISIDDIHLIQGICDRRFGIGADGLILLENKEGYDFEMIYFNSDGHPSSMCGNGGRCIVAFAKELGLIESSAKFHAVDGPHEAKIFESWVELKMGDVEKIHFFDDHFEINTGSPHYVTFVEDIDDVRVVENAQAIRYSEPFREKGINVNFVEAKGTELVVFTYERGVEEETLSCGTGVTAAALAFQSKSKNVQEEVAIRTKGGQLKVRSERVGNAFQNIWLCGPTMRVFEGIVDTKAVGKQDEPKFYTR